MNKLTKIKLIPLIKEYEKNIRLLIEENESLKYIDNSVFKNTDIWNGIEESKEIEYSNHFVVLLNGDFIGVCGSPIINYDKNEHGFYFQLKNELWGLGFGTIIAKKLLNHMHLYNSDIVIYANAVAINIPSTKILKNLGFVKTGEEFKLHNGLDIVRYKYRRVS